MSMVSPSMVKHIFLFSAFFVVIISCSTVRVLENNESVLQENIIQITNSEQLQPSDLDQYIRQQPRNSFLFGWNPFLVIYNWKNGKGGGWDNFVSKVGQPPVILDSFLVERSNVNIVNHLNSIGYYNSVVSDTIITKNKRSKVIYTVTVGDTYSINDISYNIKDTSIERLVKDNMSGTLLKSGKRLAEELLDSESERIASILRTKGYYNFSKNYFFFEADTLRRDGTADLSVKIENHTRNETPKDAKPHKVYTIRNIRVYPDYDPMVGRIDTSGAYIISKFDNFDLYHRGTRTIKRSVLDKMNTLRKGDLYNENDATNTYNRLVALRYFSGVNIQYDEVVQDSLDNSDQVDCTIRLTPSKSQGYKLNLEASSNSNNLFGISPAVSYYHKNLFRGGEWFTLGFMGNFQFKLNDPVRSTELGISAGLSVPSFLLMPDSLFKTNVPRTDINIGYNYQSRPEFTRNLISLNYGYNWRSGDRFFYNVYPLQLSIVKLFDVSSSFYETLNDPFLRNAYRNHFDLGSGATIYYTTDASAIPQKSFFYARWTNDIAGNIVSMFNKSLSADTTGAKTIWNTPYAQYFRSDLTVGYTYKPNSDYSLATRLNIGIGYAYGNSRVLPFEKLFYAGGANSLRGWQPRSVGPGSAAVDSTFSIPNQTGDMKLEANLEYRFKMFWMVEGALFADAGNIWTLRNEAGREEGLFRFRDFYKSIAINWGVGARLNLDFVILRLDLGIVARDPYMKRWIGPKDWFKKDTYSLQFGVGYPF